MENDTIEALSRQLKQRERELSAVIAITHALQARLDLSDLMRQGVLAAMSTVDADAGSLLLHDVERHKLVFRHAEGSTRDKVLGLEFDDDRGIAGEVFHSGIALISPNVTNESTHILDIDQATNYQTSNMITIPLRAGTNETIGVLQIINKHNATFNEEDLAVVEVLATQVASAIVTAQLYECAQASAIVDLLGQISHDIKNLLTPVTMAGQTLRLILSDFNSQIVDVLAVPGQTSAELAPAINGKVEMINRDMAEIIDILDESTLIAQDRTKELADAVKGLTTPAVFELAIIDDIITGVYRVLHNMATQREVSLQMTLAKTYPILLDRHRIYNAIYNLVGNALDCTPQGGTISITTTMNEDGEFPDGQYLQIAVTDTGCGMPVEVAKYLFNGHARSTKPGGTGLGTRVVKNVVNAHGGKIYVNSVEGKGTAISIRLPMRK